MVNNEQIIANQTDSTESTHRLTYAQTLGKRNKRDISRGPENSDSINTNDITTVLYSFLTEIKTLFRDMMQQQSQMLNNVIQTITTALLNKK